MRATGVHFPDPPQGDNPGQQLYHAGAEQLDQLGHPRCDEALIGMVGPLLTCKCWGLVSGSFHL